MSLSRTVRVRVRRAPAGFVVVVVVDDVISVLLFRARDVVFSQLWISRAPSDHCAKIHKKWRLSWEILCKERHECSRVFVEDVSIRTECWLSCQPLPRQLRQHTRTGSGGWRSGDVSSVCELHRDWLASVSIARGGWQLREGWLNSSYKFLKKGQPKNYASFTHFIWIALILS